MKLKKTANPRQVNPYSPSRSFSSPGSKSSQSPDKPVRQWQTVQNNPNSYRCPPLSSSFGALTNKQTAPSHHHYNAGINSRQPRIANQFEDTDITPPSFRLVIAQVDKFSILLSPTDGSLRSCLPLSSPACV